MDLADCPLCQGKADLLWSAVVDGWSGEVFAVFRCRQCRVGFTYPPPSAEDWARYDKPPIGSGWLARRVRRYLRHQRARLCSTGLTPGRALEVGCGDGWLLKSLQGMGWRVTGTERDAVHARPARRLGLDVQAGDLKACAFPDASFDLVILWHVLEHLPDPSGTLREVARILHPAGRLVIATPNLDSDQARRAGAQWLHLDVPRHLYHFSPATLLSLLQECGFCAVQVRRPFFSYEVVGWWDWSRQCAAARRGAGRWRALAAAVWREGARWVAGTHQPATMMLWAYRAP